MTCTPVSLNGMHAIICTRTRRSRAPRCKCGSGLAVTRECDWKVGNGKTCDAKLCASCTHSPAVEKDLCPNHRKEWEGRRAKGGG